MELEDTLINVAENPTFIIVSKHLKGIKQLKSYCHGFVESEEHLDAFLEEFCAVGGVSFVTRDSSFKKPR